jgi:hypothetical protein
MDKHGIPLTKFGDAMYALGPHGHKEACLVVLEDVPQLLNETDKEWTDRRKAKETKWMRIYNSHWPRGFNTEQCRSQTYKHLQKTRIHKSYRKERQSLRGNKRPLKTPTTPPTQPAKHPKIDSEWKDIQDYTNAFMDTIIRTTSNQDVTSGIPQKDTRAPMTDQEMINDEDLYRGDLTVHEARHKWAKSIFKHFDFNTAYTMLQSIHIHVRSNTFSQEMLQHWSTPALHRVLLIMDSGYYSIWTKQEAAITKCKIRQQIRTQRAKQSLK